MSTCSTPAGLADLPSRSEPAAASAFSWAAPGRCQIRGQSLGWHMGMPVPITMATRDWLIIGMFDPHLSWSMVMKNSIAFGLQMNMVRVFGLPGLPGCALANSLSFLPLNHPFYHPFQKGSPAPTRPRHAWRLLICLEVSTGIMLFVGMEIAKKSAKRHYTVQPWTREALKVYFQHFPTWICLL